MLYTYLMLQDIAKLPKKYGVCVEMIFLVQCCTIERVG